MVEVLAAHAGHTPASDRLVHTAIGESLRYISHRESRVGSRSILTLELESKLHGVAAQQVIELDDAAAAIRSSVSVRNTAGEALVLQSVTSWSAAIGSTTGADPIGDWTLTSGTSDWLAEGRWQTQPLRALFPQLAEELTGHNPRGSHSATSAGTWSTGRALPVGFVASTGLALAWAWQVEHNGAWRWELGQDTPGAYLALSGPTESDSSFTTVLATGESFTSVPVSLAVAADFESAVAELTTARRIARRAHADNTALSVVFNDYMNTLNGDPTTEKLLPLIGAAAAVGAEIFCIDAGWYDDSGHWWSSVGEWLPSTTRFPGGLIEVVDAIRAAGMTAGLWLEPEVVGVKSPLADILPLEAFVLRHGRRVVEHDRYHLDLRHPAAIAHLDGVVDRLVAEFGIGFFKFDYNINPGAGTDHNSDSLGDGLLAMNRAHLAWLDALLDRHPGLVIENCASGAMRMDFALMSRLAMQSTSDQQDFLRFPPIAAAAPASLIPEQAANWAYPQPGMSPEHIAFCLATGLLGRFYLSGYLNEMSTDDRELVAEAVAIAKTLRSEIISSTPRWPGGLPGWNDEWVSLALRGPESELLTIWNRTATSPAVLEFPHYAGQDLLVSTVFPKSLDQWQTHWDSDSGTLTVHAASDTAAARTLRLTPVRT
jgi:alpha-galactosidase